MKYLNYFQSKVDLSKNNFSKPSQRYVGNKSIKTSWYLPGYILLGDDGQFLKFRDKNKQEKNLLVYIGNKGRKYVSKNNSIYYVDELVMGAFGNPKPNDGIEYVIGHKDGDQTNDDIRNLAWMTLNDAYPDKLAKTDQSIKLTKEVIIHRSGKVYHKGRLLDVLTYNFDSDLDLFVPKAPQVEYPIKDLYGKKIDKRHDLDELMEEAGYINGNKYRHKNPVVLHRDNDYLNFNSDNLEWVDHSDPRYKDYNNHRSDMMFEYGKEMNESYPEFMRPDYI